jgi:acyl-CoA synthetase (AMP-forming)/AMP-acid ligase II
MLGWWRDRAEAVVITTDLCWSGAELLERAAGAARHLSSIATDTGAVPALLTSSPAAFAYVIGGADCGRPIAPLGPRLTAHELHPCIENLGSDVLLVEREFIPLGRQLASSSDCELVVVDIPPRSKDTLDLAPAADDVAFVLHTSGTTGTPKPVAYRQAQLAQRTQVNVDLCSLGPRSVYATASPFHHIAGFGNYAVALAAGAASVPVSRFTVEAWKGLAAFGTTHALTVPTVLDMLLDEGVLALPDLRVLQYGASPIHPVTLRRVLDALPDVDLVNIFGQTEGSPITCLTAQDHRRIVIDGRDDLLESVGRAALGVELRIEGADASGVGEVVGRAPHFFRPDPDGWLRTGDMGRLDDEGHLFLSGRRGDKIIRGGENIYPVEVEQVLEHHPDVREAAVVGVPDRRWGEIVRAVVVLEDPTQPPEFDDLQAHVRAQLAGFKVPAEWVVADELPRNAAGKLLRRRLLVDPQWANQ